MRTRITSHARIGSRVPPARCLTKFGFTPRNHLGPYALRSGHRRVASRVSLDDGSGNMGGSGNGGDNFGGGDGWEFEDDGGRGRRGPNARPFVIIAAFLAIVSGAPKVIGYIQKKLKHGFGSSDYDVEPVTVLKRLVRELFEKDVDVQARLAKLEQRLGISEPSGLLSGVSRLSTREHAAQEGDPVSHPATHLGGRLTLGGGFMWSSMADNLEAVVDCGVQLGTQLTLQSRGRFRDGRDFILTDINIDGAAQEQFNLQKVLYSCGLSKNIRLSMAPFGAKGNDVTYTLNPFAGRGLTDASAEGNPLMHNRGRGAAIGATMNLPRVWLTGSVFRNEDDGGDKALLQAIVAPTKRLSLGLTMLEGPSGDSLVSRQLARFLNGGPSVSSQSSVYSAASASAGEVAGTVALSIGGNFAVHGWAASSSLRSMFDRMTPAASAAPSPTAWNVSFGDTLRDGSSRWLASVGKVSEATGKDLEPDALEFSTEFDLGNGMTWQPGVVAVRDQRNQWTVRIHTPAHQLDRTTLSRSRSFVLRCWPGQRLAGISSVFVRVLSSRLAPAIIATQQTHRRDGTDGTRPADDENLCKSKFDGLSNSPFPTASDHARTPRRC